VARTASPRNPFVAGHIEAQARLRPPEPARDLDTFLEFLEALETVFGGTDRPSRAIVWDRFLL